MKNRKGQKESGIGIRLREARKLAGLSQGQAAKLMDMHRPTISAIEAGNRRVTTNELTAFSDMYDVDTAWLLGDTPNHAGTDDPRIQLAARELSKLSHDDLDRMLRLLVSIRGQSPAKSRE